jgi:uncharacterized membrane protein
MRIYKSSTLALLALAALLGACAEKAQTATRKSDAVASSGANPAYAAPGWKSGDQSSWEAQIRNRGQNQNEYSRTPAAGK